jgi:membrane protein YdbS with pleckstrin-like domain
MVVAFSSLQCIGHADLFDCRPIAGVSFTVGQVPSRLRSLSELFSFPSHQIRPSDFFSHPCRSSSRNPTILFCSAKAAVAICSHLRILARHVSGLQLLGPVVRKLSVADTSPGMTEEIVWRGTSSQWKNFGVYLLCGLFCWLVVPIFFALYHYLQTKCKIFEVTTQRFKTTSGIFSKVTETLELYRVKGIETHQPFLSRMVGVENVPMNTSDASSPFVFIEAVPSSVGLADKIRNQVEIIRQQKRVREIDIE